MQLEPAQIVFESHREFFSCLAVMIVNESWKETLMRANSQQPLSLFGLACVASVPVRMKSFFRDRRAFSAFWLSENWGESKKDRGGGGRPELNA